jgi:hypothetical protein
VTTPLTSEPVPGDGQVPYMSVLVDRLYSRLPEVYRQFDAADKRWTFKRYLGAAAQFAGTVDDIITGIAGEDPVGPALPEPWGLDGQELINWRDRRRIRPSSLGDPEQADAKWLTWLAQLVGARLDPAASVPEQRDTIKYATSGWRAGTRQAIADAARTALTGTRYAKVLPHTVPVLGGGGVTDGTIWDVTVVTNSAETPDPDAVLGAILRKGVKPAGVVLHVTSYGSSWDLLEAYYPTWADLEAATWDEIEQIGMGYSVVPGNILTNPSFEADATHWAAGASTTIGRIAGGLDGVGQLRVTRTATTGTGTVTQDGAVLTPVTPGQYLFTVGVKPDLARSITITANYFNGVSALSTESAPALSGVADEWNRAGGYFTAPATCNKIVWTIAVAAMGAGEFYDVDAAYLRRAS